jgi:NADH:ubiquinone oxidoreductase subunit C
MSVASLVHARLPALRALVPARHVGDVDVLRVPVEHLRTVLSFLRDDADVACDHLVDVTVVDEGQQERSPDAGPDAAPRFLLVVLLTSRAHGTRVRVESALDDDDPTYPTLTTLWPGALLPEREVWDLFGVTAAGHPSLRRMFLPDDTAGHPGRRDAAVTPSPARAATTSSSPTGRAVIIIDDNRGPA